MDDVKGDLDRYSTRARDKAEDTYREGKEKGRGVWGSIQDFFGMLSQAAALLVGCLLMNMSVVGWCQGCMEVYAGPNSIPSCLHGTELCAMPACMACMSNAHSCRQVCHRLCLHIHLKAAFS